MMSWYGVLFSVIVFLGPLISLSTSNWLLVWGGMELSLISLLPILNLAKSSIPVESAMKYFLVQASASAVILITGLNIYMLEGSEYLILILFILGLILKLGVVPLHFWVIPVVKGLKYIHMAFLLGPLKIVPLMLLMTNMNLDSSIFLFLLVSSIGTVLLGALLGNNMSSIRMMLGASSISHSGWFLMGGLVGFMWIYFSIYMISLYVVLYYLKVYPSDNYLVSIFLFSLSGLPPFLMFPAKMMVLYSLLSMGLSPIVFSFFIISAIVSLNFYMKFSFSFVLSSSENQKNFGAGVMPGLLLMMGGFILFFI
uniref:NADH-ubiquinone oxidoreductase chain 2 n=1 Tax=Gastrocopta cristata TaxID=1128339 RepID=A0A0A6ZAG9_9EUPU|nr:NADH dehydrogenase subunit 2 [Gastrocopta cristata]AGC52862.1 NADH dehydrogenase subunit 2 [Gastrocopta cristata]